MALTADRATQQKDGVLISLPVSAGVKCYAGGIAVTNGGYAEPGTEAAGLACAGMFTETVDNTTGADGDKSVPVRRGRAFKWSNSTSADEITNADILSDCYIVDDETVAKTSDAGTRSKAGKVIGVESDGVWVEIPLLPEPAATVAAVTQANAATQTGSYVQADAQTIADLANANKTALNALITSLKDAGVVAS